MSEPIPLEQLPWSHSSLSTFTSCPKKFYELKVAKSVEDSQNEMSIWGSRVHKAFEDYLTIGTPLPAEMVQFQSYIDSIKSIDGTQMIEVQLALTKQKKPHDFYDKPWVRGIIDVLIVRGTKALIIDHKLGKIKPSTQLLLNALLVFAHYPGVNEVRTVFSWLQFNQSTKAVYYRKDIDSLWQQFEREITPYEFAFKSNIWVTRPSGLCNGWCPVESCAHWRPKRVR